MNDQRASFVILTHIMHRMYDFLTLFPAEQFATDAEVGRAFLVWLAQQDRDITEHGTHP